MIVLVDLGITCEISAVSKMAGRKLPLNYLPFSHPGLVECMKEWFIHFYYITAMLKCLQSFVIHSFGGNILHAAVPMKKAFIEMRNFR